MKRFSDFLIEMIRKRGDKFVVMDSKGKKVLGTHESKKKAQKQLAAIEISKKSLSESISIPNRNFSGFYHPDTKKTILLPFAGPENQHGYFVFKNPNLFGFTDSDIEKAAGTEVNNWNADEYAGVFHNMVHKKGWVRVHGQDSGRKSSSGSRLYSVFMSSTDENSLRKAITNHSRDIGTTIDSITADFHTTIEKPDSDEDIDWDKAQSVTINTRTDIPSALDKLFETKKEDK
jgi:hypothetical protein